jgi:hypothetical protein
MKRVLNWIFKILLLVITLASLALLFSSRISIKVDNTSALAKSALQQAAAASQDSDVKIAATLMTKTDLADGILKKLPQKLRWQFSYLDLYQVAENYQQNGKVTSADLGFSQNNEYEQLVGQLLAKNINQQLESKQAEVAQAVSIYRIAFWLIIIIYVLAMVLILFGRRGASLLLLLASVAAYAGLSLATAYLNNAISASTLSGISVSLSSMAMTGLVLALIVVIANPFLRRIMRKHA